MSNSDTEMVDVDATAVDDDVILLDHHVPIIGQLRTDSNAIPTHIDTDTLEPPSPTTIETTAATAAADSSITTAAAAAAPPSPVKHSRSGRAVLAPKPLTYSGTEAPKKSQATKASSKGGGAQKKPTTAGSKRKRGKHQEDDYPGYQGEGFTVTDHSWYPGQCKIEYASPRIDHLETMYARVSCEQACQQAGLTMTREMKVDLSNETIDDLKRCIGGDHEKGETNKTVLSLCNVGEIRGCALYQSDVNDVDSIKVVTTRFIKNAEVITIYMGRLVEADQFYADYGDRDKYNVSSYDLKRDQLPPDYTGPDLMLDTNVVANEAKFIRDARWDDHEISPNVQCRVVWNHAKGLPYVAMIALGDIAEHAELFVDWGEAAWRAHARAKLHRLAHISYEQHFRLKQLQDALAEKGIEPYASRPKVSLTDDVGYENFHVRAESEEEIIRQEQQRTTSTNQLTCDVKIIGEEVVPNPTSSSKRHSTTTAASSSTSSTATAAASAASSSQSSLPLENVMPRTPPKPDPRGQTPTFVFRNTKHVFDNSHVELMSACDYSGLSDETIAAWIQAAPKQGPISSKLRTVLETGRCPKAGVYEVVSLRHPARFYSPPDGAVYALLARETIDKHEPIGVYVGKVHEAEIFHGDYKPEDRIKQVYAYDMTASLFPLIGNMTESSSSTASSTHILPANLICESLSRGGNETRYVNDRWCRRGGQRVKNAEAIPTIDPLHGNMPVMVITATRRIEKGEEIVTDYGETFWCKISTALCMEHNQFQQKASQQIKELEQELQRLTESNQLSTSAVASSSSSSSTAAAAAASSTSSSEYVSPPPPGRWESYRELYNQFDVIYTHSHGPVRYDPQLHHDPLPRQQWEQTRLARREQVIKAHEKAERARQRELKAKKKAEPVKVYTTPAGARASSRVSNVQQQKEAEAAKRKEEQARRAAEVEAKKAAKLAAKLEKESAKLAASMMDLDDSDVEEIPPPPRIPIHPSLQLSQPKEVVMCSDCGEVGGWRTWKDLTFKACRDCFKKRCSQQMSHEQSFHAARHANGSIPTAATPATATSSTTPKSSNLKSSSKPAPAAPSLSTTPSAAVDHRPIRNISIPLVLPTSSPGTSTVDPMEIDDTDAASSTSPASTLIHDPLISAKRHRTSSSRPTNSFKETTVEWKTEDEDESDRSVTSGEKRSDLTNPQKRIKLTNTSTAVKTPTKR